jgi:hypothetical protein
MNDGKPERDGEEAVEPPDHRAREQRDQDRQQAGDVIVGDQEVHDEGRELVDEPDGQVDLAADQQHDLAEREDDDRRRELGHGDQVGVGEERLPPDRGDESEVDDQQDVDHEDGRLPLPGQQRASISQRPQSAPRGLLRRPAEDLGRLLYGSAHLRHPLPLAQRRAGAVYWPAYTPSIRRRRAFT